MIPWHRELYGRRAPSGAPRRRAVMYAAVVGATALVTAIGLAALTAVRIESRSVHGSGDALEAMLYARSAVEMGLLRIRSDPNWRTNFLNGVWESNRRIGQGTYTLEGIDPIDGILSNLLNEPLTLRGTGVKGDARYKLQVRLESTGVPLTCLQVPMHAGGNITFNSATVTGVGGPVTSNGSVSASSSNILAAVQAVSGISGSLYLGGKTSGMTAKTMPGSSVFDYYIANGTSISFSSIGKSSGTTTLQNVVLSSLNNPFGATNQHGIYVINCAGANFRIRNAQIIGTLVVLDPGTFTVTDSVNWTSGVANYPALLVRGNVALSYTNVALLLNSLSLPSLITGLIYASGNVATSSTVTVQGVLVAGGTISSQNTLALTYLPTFSTSPPPGFGNANDKMDIVAGSWTRVVD